MSFEPLEVLIAARIHVRVDERDWPVYLSLAVARRHCATDEVGHERVRRRGESQRDEGEGSSSSEEGARRQSFSANMAGAWLLFSNLASATSRQQVPFATIKRKGHDQP